MKYEKYTWIHPLLSFFFVPYHNSFHLEDLIIGIFIDTRFRNRHRNNVYHSDKARYIPGYDIHGILYQFCLIRMEGKGNTEWGKGRGGV